MKFISIGKSENGDMMLALSDEPIDSSEKPHLRCLICYIAPRVESGDGSYIGCTTYLTYGKPIQHHAFCKKKEFKAESNTFHLGCNADDLMTFCLRIDHLHRKVSLRHAGPNSIYNHEEISCEFSKTELDLMKLEYINITTGAQNVSVRNLIICFEKQSDLHPTFDKDFKRSIPDAPKTSSLSDTKGPSDAKHYGSSSLKPCRDNVNCLLHYATNESGAGHNAKFSHPCRFSELCQNKEPHLTHDDHSSPLCTYDKDCKKLTDPFHRAKYRHTNLPDFLIPCRHHTKCHDKSNEHRIKYSHGEQVFENKSTTTADGKF